MKITLSMFGIIAMLLLPVYHADADEQWLVGKWELVFDPDGAKKDWLEFLANGDVRSQGRLGDVQGFYILTPKGVKAVFTYQEKDFIMNFHYDRQTQALKIVTSHTGRESVYKRIE